MAEKKQVNRLLWLDLEMTGLDPSKDKILEVGAVMTDDHLAELGSAEAVVVQSDEVLAGMSPFVRSMHAHNGLLDRIPGGMTDKAAELMIINLIETRRDSDAPIVLAGNSIHIDRGFIRSWWPLLEQKLHYRMLDVTSWKLIMEQRGIYHEKSEKHRALGDARESIAELKTYLSHMDIAV